MDLAYDPRVPLPCTYPEELISVLPKRHLCSMFVAALVTTAKLGNQPIHQWMKKMWYIYTMEYYSVTKKKEILSLTATWESRRHYVQWNKSGTERQIPYILTYMQKLKMLTS
jgi:hypothetical protein